MSTIHFFGHNQHYPRGGVNDLRASWDRSAISPQCVEESSGLLTAPGMAEFLERHDAGCEFYQVVHLDERGGVRTAEFWANPSTCQDYLDKTHALEVSVSRFGLTETFVRYRVDFR